MVGEIRDLVVDANVLVHATSSNVHYHDGARELVSKMFNIEAQLCVDPGFTFDEVTNASLIASEYLKHLNYAMIGYQLIVHLAQNGRIKFVSRNVSGPINLQIRELIRRNKRDRTYVRVAFNAHEKLIASHDFDDFGKSVRKKLKKKLGVQVFTAVEILTGYQTA